jgi:hypothetical protein
LDVFLFGIVIVRNSIELSWYSNYSLSLTGIQMGRSSLIMVMGLSLVLLCATPGLKRDVNMAYENYLTYVNLTHVHNISVSGANMAASQIFFNNSWTTGYSGLSYDGGTLDVSVTTPSLGRTLITSIGTLPNSMVYGQMTTLKETTQVLLQPSSFSKFGVYASSMGGVYWATGDVVRGPLHINNVMNILGTPRFYGKVTTKNGTNPAHLPTANAHPRFFGTYQSGIDIPLPGDISIMANAAATGGKLFTPPANPPGAYVVEIKLIHTGRIRYKEYKGGTLINTVNDWISNIGVNNVVVVQGGDMNIEGEITGQATFGALASGGNGGNVHITGDITCNTSPRHHPESTDMIGIVADGNVDIPLPPGFPHPNAPNDLDIEAAIFARTGSFNAAYDSRMGVLGNVRVWGSVVANALGAFAVGDGNGNVLYGYHNIFDFDQRLMVSGPPAYPTTGILEVMSWKE